MYRVEIFGPSSYIFRLIKETPTTEIPGNNQIENSQKLWRSSGPNHFFEIFSPSTKSELERKGLFSLDLTNDPVFKLRTTFKPFHTMDRKETVKKERIKSQLNFNEKKRSRISFPFQDNQEVFKLRTTLKPFHSSEKPKKVKKGRKIARSRNPLVLKHRARKVHTEKEASKCDKQNLEGCVDGCTDVEDILEYSGCVVQCSEVCKSPQYK